MQYLLGTNLINLKNVCHKDFPYFSDINYSHFKNTVNFADLNDNFIDSLERKSLVIMKSINY